MGDKLYTIKESRLKAIADAIREVEGSSEPINLNDFATRIKALTIAPDDPAIPEVDHVEIAYSFDNDIAGNGAGVITLLAKDSEGIGNYDIMWGDADGIMSNYSAVNSTSIELAEGVTFSYAHLIEINAIPKYATRICAVKDGEIKASFIIPESKRFTSGSWGNHLYSIEVLSDVHYQYESGSEDWNRAFIFGRDRENIQAICIAGDLCDSGQQSHLNVWKSARDSVRGTTPVYSCTGNHESYSTSTLMYTNSKAVRPYLDTDYDSTSGDPWFSKTINGDIYVFMPIFEGVVASASAVMFSAEALAWLEDVLEENRNRRVFLFAHVPPSAKFTVDGFGIANYAYGLDLWGGKSNTTAKDDRIAFLDLMAHYKNVIWFNGHSHIKYQYQELYKGLNYYRHNTDGARLIHVSSLTVPRDIIDGSVSDYLYAESEGYVMDVYDNCILLRGRNFVDEKYLGLASFMLDTRPVTIEAKPDVPEEPVVTLTSITVVKTNKTYNVGDTVATNDITVTAHYSDGSSQTVSGWTASTVNTSTAGDKTLTVTYQGKTATITITVNEVVVPDEPSNTYIVLGSATASGSITGKGGQATVVANYGDYASTPSTNVSSGYFAMRIDESMRNKPLYYRLASSEGTNATNKVGWIVAPSKGYSTSSANIPASTRDYQYTSTEWSPWLDANGNPYMVDGTYHNIAGQFKASSSSTATFPVTVNCTIEFAVKA